MEDQLNPLGASSIEDVLSKAMWISSVIDPSLCIDQLNETFCEVIFSFPEADEPVEEVLPRIRTAAEKQREAKRKQEMREELLELNDDRALEDEPTDDDLDDELDDEGAEDEMRLEDQAFLDWIQAVMPATESRIERAADDQEAVELDLSRIGLSADQQALALDALPERLMEISKREGRAGLGSKLLPGGYTYELSLEHEAYWILRQLRNAGQPLAHNTRICALASHPLNLIIDDPVMVAIIYALQKMTREYLEPAHLMVYHQTPLHPLLFALFEDSKLQKDGEHTVPMTSYAYSSLSGARQRPYLNENDIGFHTLAKRSIGTRDPIRNNFPEKSDFAYRKPCFIELGRLLVHILELDTVCHQLEYRRQQMLLMLRSSTEGSVQNQRTILEHTVFETAVDVGIWHAFVQSLVGTSRSRSAYRRVQELGLQEAFEEYSLTGLQYQENLVRGEALSLCPSQRVELREWAEQVAKGLSQNVSPEFIVSLFNNAIIDQFSKLPVLCRKIMDLFSTVGHLIVTYNWVKKPDDIYPLSTFYVEHPRHYLELLQLKSQDQIDLHYVVDEALVRRVLRENELYHVRPSAASLNAYVEEEWYTQRQEAFNGLVARLMESIVPRVEGELRQQALYHTTRNAMERVGAFCSLGPYQRTKLALTDYDPDAVIWKPEWDVVEALPVLQEGDMGEPRISQRVCAVYRGENGVSSFVFIDEKGSVIGKLRWGDQNRNTEIGRVAYLNEENQLLKLIQRYYPSVLVVGASSADSLELMDRLQRFLTDIVYPELRMNLPIVWAGVDIPRFFSQTHFADAEMPFVDVGLRTSVGLARFVQDPLQVIATLFDHKKTALQLFGSSSYRDQQQELYSSLCWEVSLWVGACGFWLDDVLLRPHGVALLQFVPGFGLLKASRFQKYLHGVRLSDRRSLAEHLKEEFSEFISANASPTIRIAPPSHYGGEDEVTRWHPLDQTLIPLELYDVALYVAAAATQREQGLSKRFLHFNLIEFIFSPTFRKHQSVHSEIADGRHIVKDLRRGKTVKGYDLILGNREIEFIADELVANGRSFMRRPYRRITTKALLLYVAGVAFFSKEECASRLQLPSADLECEVIQEGAYVSGIIEGFRLGSNPGIRMTTSRGLRCFFPASEVSDETLRFELLDYLNKLVEAREYTRSEDAESRRAPLTPPDWLRRGGVIQGTVFRCQWGRCELLLQWCPPRNLVVTENSQGEKRYISYADVLRDAASSVNSLRTVQIEANAAVFSSKISDHVLFRDITRTEAMEMLRDKEIGEVLFRPSTGKKSKSICMIKIGSVATCNLLIQEDRRSDGSIFFRVHDTVVKEQKEFNNVDDFHQNFVKPMIDLVFNLRSHRRFVDSLHDVQSAFMAAQQGAQQFAYVFVENTKKMKPPFYRVYTRGGGKERHFDLHINEKCIYVSLPFFPTRNGVAGKAVYRWVECSNSERLSEVLKNHAIRSS